jgi:DeoR/GlpR family transcriptional regulator of sugar metabolism
MNDIRGTGKAIIHCLSENPGITIKQAYYHVLPVIAKPISYQAVHKKIVELEQEGIVERKEGRCFLSDKWLAEVAALAQHAIQKIKIMGNIISADSSTVAEIRKHYRQHQTPP